MNQNSMSERDEIVEIVMNVCWISQFSSRQNGKTRDDDEK
jgi:hypothetical protein